MEKTEIPVIFGFKTMFAHENTDERSNLNINIFVVNAFLKGMLLIREMQGIFQKEDPV